MNELVYSFRDNNVRVVEIDNVVWFVAKDVCEVLEITNTTHAVKRLDDDERTSLKLGRQGETNIVNEYGLYSLILSSRKPEAKEFKRWVTHEVLPQIRKKGSYNMPSTYKDALLALVAEVEKTEKLEQQVAIQAPKVVLAESIERSDGLILVRELATILVQAGHDTGQNRLYAWLRDNGYLTKSNKNKNMPTQKSKDQGLFKLVESVVPVRNGEMLTKVAMVTGKGQQYFVAKFNKGV